jgi:transcriptional regulator with XRE-family HTH domain
MPPPKATSGLKRVNGRQIAAARVYLGISQSELALASQVAARTIAHWEKGGRELHDRTLDALVEALEFMGVEFLSDEKGVGIRVREPKLSELIVEARTSGGGGARRPKSAANK